jgi:hypothetical protein
MEATATQKELWSYLSSNEFISKEKIEDFQQRLTKEGKLPSLNYALKTFIPAECPKCNASGAFKWHFLGKLSHPACTASWYVAPGTYVGKQIKAVFSTGGEMAGEMTSKAKGTGEGIIGMLMGFIMGVSFRLPFAVLMLPIQAVVSLSQKKN